MKIIDIHCHILPGVDDGPETVEEACKMLDRMVRDHVCAVIATPHYRAGMFEPSREEVLSSYRVLRKEATERGIKLYLGTEFHRQMEMIEMLEQGFKARMAGTEYVLVEFSSMDLFGMIRNQVYDLVVKGYQPIIAHVERYGACRNVEQIRELRDLGAYIQVNSDTILGKFGWSNKRFAAKLLKEDLVDFVASDAHDTKKRKSSLAECAEYVKRKYGLEQAKELFYKNSARLINSGRK